MAERRRSKSEIAALNLSKVGGGSLPHVRVSRIWAGAGSNRPCYGCEEAIGATEVEVEIELADAVALRLHQRCFRAWQKALDKVTPDPAGDGATSS